MSLLHKSKTISYYLLVTILGGLTLVSAADRVAVTTKVKGTVELRSAGSNNYKEVTPGTVLFDEDFIRTGANGFLVLVYLDDKSMLKIKGNTGVEIKGKRTGDGISKKVDMTGGTLKVDVSKRRKGDFIVTTPTSVASVKGTSFWMVSTPGSDDQCFGLEGLVELLNQVSGTVVTVGADQTATSSADGTIGVEPTVAGQAPEDEDEAAAEMKELKIRFQDAEGEERILIIKYN